MTCQICAEHTYCLHRWRTMWVCKTCLGKLREMER